MTPSAESGLVEVDIHVFRSATRDINFDVFLKLSDDNHAHVFSKTTGLDYKRLAQYIQKGVEKLHIRAEDLELYQAFIARPAHVLLNDPQTSQEKKIAILLNMTEQNIAELFCQVPISEETALASQRVIHSYVELMVQSPNTLAVILKLVSHGDYLYYHAIAVAIFSAIIAKGTGQFSQKTLELIGLGGFLHDIGMTLLPKELSGNPSDLTPEQLETLQTHPKLGMRLIENTPNIADPVRHIVYQHHEEPSGRGYPNGLHGNTIYYPAKVVALADAFSELISKRPFRAAHSAEQAVAMIQKETGKFDPELVQIMASVFRRQAARAA